MTHREFKSEPGELITFTIGDDPFLFRALPKPPGGALLSVMLTASKIEDADEEDDKDRGGMEAVTAIMDFLDAALEGESREHFVNRFDASATADGFEPISIEQATEVARWLISEQGASRRDAAEATAAPAEPAEPAAT